MKQFYLKVNGDIKSAQSSVAELLIDPNSMHKNN